VTLEGANGTQIHKVAKGTADQDAVNLSQLKDAGVKTDASGNVTNAFVAYDDKTKKDSVTLEGANGTQIHKVAKGTADQDAINLSQLKEAGIKTDASGNFTNALVAYDDKTMNSVTLGGVNGTTIDKVKAGKLSSTSMEAVNGAQLYATNEQVNKNTGDITNINNTINNINKSSGLIAQDEVSREITIGAKTDGTSISLTGTAGNRVVSGVAAGEVSATSTQAINGSQLHNTASSVATALGGGAGIDANGGVTPPTYHVGGVDTHDVGTALSNIDGRVTQITTTVNEASKNAVKYDSDAHDKVTLGGTDAAGGEGVQLTNVKAGELSATSTDAINGAQLNATNVRIDQYESIVNNISTGSEYLAINSEKGSPLPTATGKDAVALGSNSKATGDNSVALGANSVADQPNTVSVGSEGNERRITNLAPGKAGTDAANVNQLNDVRNSVLANQRAAFGGVASALAMPNMTPREAGNTVVAVGIGSYKGYSAVGVSGTYRSRDGAWLLNGGFSSTGHGDAGVRAQVGYEF
jgi:autotransporter adhesin